MDVKIKNLNKKAQVSIFIIIGVIVVAAILLFLFFRTNITPEIKKSSEKNPEYFLDNCLNEGAESIVRKILKNGGYMENPLHKELDGENITYLCYTENYYTQCTNQEPLLVQHVKKELKENSQGIIENCFYEWETNLENDGYGIEIGSMNFDVELAPKKIIFDIKRKIVLSKSGTTSKFENFEIQKLSKLYELTVIAQEIVSQEAEYCNFDHLGFMIIYPEYDIEKFRTGDGDVIYSIKDKKTQEEFKFAVRSCIMPGGL